MPDHVRPRVRQVGLHVFAIAMNGTTVTVDEPLYPGELEQFLREEIESWKLDDVLRLSRTGTMITLERIDGGPTGGPDAPGSASL